MKPITFVEIEIRQPRYDPNPEKSKTNNSAWRHGLFVIFKDYKGNIFDWMPKWDEIDNLKIMKDKVDYINSELAKEQWRKNNIHTG